MASSFRVVHGPPTIEVRRLAADFAHLAAPRRRASTTYVQIKAAPGKRRARFVAMPHQSSGGGALHPRDPLALAHLLSSFSELAAVEDGSELRVDFERWTAGPAGPAGPAGTAGRAASAEVVVFPPRDPGGRKPAFGAVVCVARENVVGGTLHFSYCGSQGQGHAVDLEPGDLCLIPGGVDAAAVKAPVHPWDVDFDAWEDFVTIAVYTEDKTRASRGHPGFAGIRGLSSPLA